MYKIMPANGDSSNKLTDTTEFLKLILVKGSVAFTLTGYTVTMKIGNTSGYLVDVPADILSANEVAIDTQSDTFKALPPDEYTFEIWAEKDDERVIFPTDGQGKFTISPNITAFDGKTLSSMTVDQFLDKVKTTPGAPGESAYQVAVNAGFSGSVNQWLDSIIGAKGDKGDKGDAGKDFQIVKTFPSIAEMNGDGFSDGDFTMIASDVNDPDDGKLYVWNGASFTYIADLSGSQGIKGDPGEQGLSAYQVAVNAGFHGSVDEWLASLVGDKGDKGDDAVINIISQADYDALADKSGVYFIEG